MEVAFSNVQKLAANPKHVLLVIGVSKNNNFAVFEYATGVRGVEVPVYWINTEPAEVARLKAEGNPGVITPLSAAEEVLLGTDVHPQPDGRILVNVRVEQLRERKFELQLDVHGTPMLIGDLNGKPCFLDSAYIQMRKGLLPDVEYIKIYGTDMASGERQCETVLNEN